MDDVKTRLEKMAKELGIGLSKIGRSIGLSVSTLALQKNSKNGIPSEYIRLIVQNYPQVNAMYLVMGEGSVLLEPEPEKDEFDFAESVKKIEQAELAMSQLKADILEFRLKELKEAAGAKG